MWRRTGAYYIPKLKFSHDFPVKIGDAYYTRVHIVFTFLLTSVFACISSDELTANYIFTFNLSYEENKHYTKMNFMNTPPQVGLILCCIAFITKAAGHHRVAWL